MKAEELMRLEKNDVIIFRTSTKVLKGCIRENHINTKCMIVRVGGRRRADYIILYDDVLSVV